jgi:hypothetical protein
MKRLAICLYGMSYREPSQHWGGKDSIFKIDARPCKKNHDKYLEGYFKNLGFEIDYYLSTNKSEQSEWFFDTYSPVYASFDDDSTDNSKQQHHLSRNKTRKKRLANVLNGCIESKIKYNLVIAMRFDMVFCVPLSEWKIDFDGFNVMSLLHFKRAIDDNMYIMNGVQLHTFNKVMNENDDNTHEIYDKFYDVFGNVNVMYDERCRVDDFTSFKILRTFPDNTTNIVVNYKLVQVDIDNL